MDVQQACSEDEQCDFYVWHPLSVATLCTGSSTRFLRGDLSTDHIVGIRPHMFATPDFTVMSNHQAVCEQSNVVEEKNGVYSFDEATKRCRETTACTYFALSTIAGLDGMPQRYANTLWLCSGKPKFVHHLGWLSAGKLEAMPPASRTVLVDLDDGPIE